MVSETIGAATTSAEPPALVAVVDGVPSSLSKLRP